MQSGAKTAHQIACMLVAPPDAFDLEG